MAFDKESVPGLFGWALQGKNVVADTAGLFGFSASRESNISIMFVAPSGAKAIRTPLTITIAYGGNSLIISYNPDFPRIERQVPFNTVITVTTDNSYYEPTYNSFTIPVNGQYSLVINLDFLVSSIATITEYSFY